MKLSVRRKLSWTLLSGISTALFLSLSANQLAQTKPQMPAPTGHVNDLAGVVDEATKQRLENVLANLKLKTGIEFDVATVESTSGQTIADFSLQLAKDWNIGAFTSAKKSLLLVLAVNEKASFTQLSRSVRRDLPEGVLGEMSQRMRAPVEAGKFSAAIGAGVEYFVSSLAQKLAFSTDDFDKTPPATVAMSPAESVSPSNKPTDEAAPAITKPSNAEGAATVKAPAARNDSAPTRTRRATASGNATDDSEEVVLTLTKPLEERIVLLRTFLDTHPNSNSRARATELLVSARAALGDERLKKGDTAGGLEQMTQAIADTPVDTSEKLFSGVVSQIPLNLYFRGETAAALKAAQDIEAKFGNDAKRLVALSGFYLRTEQGGEATRVATKAVQLAPDLADAHQSLGAAFRVTLRLEEAAAEYKRALELDPTSKSARRGLADLDRASGKSDEALALYRQELDADAKDKAAQTGWILSLLDLGRTAEARTELDKALQSDPQNFVLFAGAAYWYAAHNDSDFALLLARRAVSIEPRYTWSEIALARALLAQRQPLEAERALRFARQYGKFPTLDYELANTLVAAGLYEEAAEVLAQSFSFKDGEIETRLGGQSLAHSTSFIDLLAPERKASIFQAVAADTENNAKLLKALLLFSVATAQENGGGAVNEEKAIAAAKEFASGDDAGRVHRQLYAANRLLQRGVGFQTAYELSEAARSSADAGLMVPALTLAVQADEFRDIRARAIAAGGTPDIPEAPRNVLSNLLRGRIEDLGGWALLNQDKVDQAVDHLRRAVAILPQGTPSARTSLWRLGVALERQDKKAEALSYFIKSYNAGLPDPVRRALIEQLYRKINGSLEGLDERIGRTGAVPVSAAQTTAPETTPEKATDTSAPATSPPESTPTTTPAVVTTVAEASPTPASEPAASPSASPVTSPSSETPNPTPQPTPASEPAPPSTSPSPAESPSPSPLPSPEQSPEQSASPVPSPSPDVSDAAPPATSPAPTPEATATPMNVAPQPRTTVSIKGKINDAGGNPLANVVIVLISAQGTVLTSTTDDQGNYSFTVAVSTATRSYRIIPSKDGLTFDPLDKVLPVVSDDVKELNFVGTRTAKP